MTVIACLGPVINNQPPPATTNNHQTPTTPRNHKQPQTIKTNCPHVIRNFSGLLCDKSHVHRKGGVSGMDGGININTWSQKYLPMMVDLLTKSIVQALSG